MPAGHTELQPTTMAPTDKKYQQPTRLIVDASAFHRSYELRIDRGP